MHSSCAWKKTEKRAWALPQYRPWGYIRECTGAEMQFGPDRKTMHWPSGEESCCHATLLWCSAERFVSGSKWKPLTMVCAARIGWDWNVVEWGKKPSVDPSPSLAEDWRHWNVWARRPGEERNHKRLLCGLTTADTGGNVGVAMVGFREKATRNSATEKEWPLQNSATVLVDWL